MIPKKIFSILSVVLIISFLATSVNAQVSEEDYFFRVNFQNNETQDLVTNNTPTGEITGFTSNGLGGSAGIFRTSTADSGFLYDATSYKSAVAQTDDFYLALRFRYDSIVDVESYEGIFSHYSNVDGERGWIILNRNDGTNLNYIYSTTGDNTNFNTLDDSPTLNDWYNIVVKISANQQQVYVDDVLELTISEGAYISTLDTIALGHFIFSGSKAAADVDIDVAAIIDNTGEKYTPSQIHSALNNQTINEPQVIENPLNITAKDINTQNDINTFQITYFDGQNTVNKNSVGGVVTLDKDVLTPLTFNVTSNNYNLLQVENLNQNLETYTVELTPAPINAEDMNLNIINTDGLTIEYDVYYKENDVKKPLVLMADSWGSSRTGRTTTSMKEARDAGFVAVALDTRGKGGSTGLRDAIGYECKDIYEVANQVNQDYSDYIDVDKGIHLYGFSAGSGKATVCSGRYPDFFTSISGLNGVNNITRWYETATTASDRPEMRERTGNSVSAQTEYHPQGYPSVSGSIENQEAYDARNGALIGTYNTFSNVFLQHADNDPRVSSQNTKDYNNSWFLNNKEQDFQVIICEGNSHSDICDNEAFINWGLNYETAINPEITQGDFLIGGWVHTKKFGVEFLDDVGYMGNVTYDFKNNGEFTLEIDTVSYTGPAEIYVNEIGNDLLVTDNDYLIANITNGVITTSNNSYSPTISDNTLTFTLPSMSPHTIQATQNSQSDAQTPLNMSESQENTRNTIYTALGIIALMLLVASAYAVITIIQGDFSPALLTGIIIGILAAGVVLIVGFVVINQIIAAGSSMGV